MIAVSDRKNDITWVSIMDQKNMNGTITNYTYNGLGRITSANGSPYTYDNNGNLLTKGSETFTYDWKNNLVRYQNSTTVEDVWLGYDIGNTLVAKGWTEEGGVTSSSSRSKLIRGKQAVLDGMPVFSRTTSTRTTNCFADLNNPYERFYIKSYNTSSMYNLMYEDTSQSSFTMLRHWIESGDFLNKYLQEHNYDQLDPTGLALGCHFGSQTARGTYAFTTDTNQSLTTQIFQNAFAQLTAVTTTELELKGVNDHRAFQSIITDPVIGGGKSSLPDYQGLDATCMGNKMGPILQRISDNWLSTVVGILSGLSHYEIVRKAFTHIAAQNTTKDPYVSEPPENKRKGPFTLYFAWCKEVFVPLPKKGNSGPATKDNGKTT